VDDRRSHLHPPFETSSSVIDFLAPGGMVSGSRGTKAHGAPLLCQVAGDGRPAPADPA